MIKLYEYPKCSTCRSAVKFLEGKNVSFKKINIVETPPSVTELKKMLRFYDGNVKKLFNTSGQLYREMKIKDKVDSLTTEQATSLLTKHGKLVKRPFILTSKEGAVGFKEEEWKKLSV